MRKLALSDKILLSVDKPARYTGGELNMTVKDPDSVDIRVCFAFPDVYDVGMSHLGMQILYDMFNRRSDIYCERVFSPWTDLHKIMKEENIPLFALESQDPLRVFDFICITLQYEMCYPNILQILDLAHIPFLAKDRTEDDPIIVGGGPCVLNPEPIADFFDLIYIGEGETSYNELFDLYKEIKNSPIPEGYGTRREYFLRMAARVPGIYCPALYEPAYNEDGTFCRLVPKGGDIPDRIKRQVVSDLSDTYYIEKPLVPLIRPVQDRVVLEVMRGCIRGCRFCQAGMIYRPLRERSLEYLKKYAAKMLESTGYEEISLSSLSTSDYSCLPELLDFLTEEYGKKGVNISLPSLRIDAFSLDVMGRMSDIRKSSLTFAPEAGTQRLRDVINKGITEEDILSGCRLAFSEGWASVKLYFMLGHPTETEEDVRAIACLAQKIAEEYYEVPKEKRNGRCRISVSTSFFVPKPFTPFQWAAMNGPDEFLSKAHIVSDTIHMQHNKKCIQYKWHDADTSMIEGVLARGDRKLSDVIIKVYEKGGIYPAWSEYFDWAMWDEAFSECGIDPDFYTTRKRAEDEAFPWDFIDAGVTKEFLLREWKKALKGETTPNCREKCSGCGAYEYGCGVCR